MELEPEDQQSCSDSHGTSKAQMYEQDSSFGDQDCGEPLQAQRLVIDFTPQDLELDSEYNQKKCRAFWEFIKSKPELKHLMAVPEVVDYGESFTSSDVKPKKSKAKAPEACKMERTAFSTIQLLQKRGGMEAAFLGAQARSHCSLGSREYPEQATTKKTTSTTHVSGSKGACDRCRCSQVRRQPARAASKGSASKGSASALAADLCTKIEKWDAEHPKSMEPPGHPANLCVAKR